MQPKLELWEMAVRERPGDAQLFGPPSWLVREEWDGKEPFVDAANRVRRRYGLDEPQYIEARRAGDPWDDPAFVRRVEAGPAYRVALEKQNPGAYAELLAREAAATEDTVDISTEDMSTPRTTVDTQTVDICEGCGDNQRASQRRLCWSCIKRQQRSPASP